MDIRVYGEVSIGKKKFLTDIDDRDRWQLVLDQNASGSLSIHMDKKSHSGALFVTANSKSLFTAGDAAKGAKQIDRAVAELFDDDAWPTWVL